MYSDCQRVTTWSRPVIVTIATNARVDPFLECPAIVDRVFPSWIQGLEGRGRPRAR